MATAELKTLVSFGLTAGELLAGLGDGIGFDDFTKLVETARKAPPGMSAAPMALQEYIDMTDEEAVDVEAYIASEFNIADDAIEAVIKQGLNVVIEIHSLVKLLMPKKAA